jgi:hypothetical protein
MKTFFLSTVLVATLSTTMPVAAQDKASQDPLAEQVRKAIAKAVTALKDARNGDNWETKVMPDHRGGYTALAVLALLNAGVPVDDPAVRDGLKFLRDKVTDPTTYTRALMTLAFVEARQNQDLQRIQDSVNHFMNKSAQRSADGRLMGWSYDRPSGVGLPDNSCTQYALLGVYVGGKYLAQNQVPVDAAVWTKFWEDVSVMYASSQTPSGGWTYARNAAVLDNETRLTMTTAGLCGTLMAQTELSAAAARLSKDPVANCGKYPENPILRAGFDWLYKPAPNGHDRFRLTVEPHPYTFYNIYGIERLGRFSGERFIGPHDWYR